MFRFYRAAIKKINLFLLETHIGGVNSRDSDDWTLLHKESSRGDLERVRHLLKKGADVNAVVVYGGWTPLNLACRGGHLEVVKLFLAKGANINAQNKEGATALNKVIQRIRYFGYNHLRKAKLLEVVKLLLVNGADIDTQDKKGFTVLHWAIKDNHLEVAQLLLEKGANTEVKNNKGETPFDIAKKKSNKEIIKLFENFQRKDK